MEHTPPALLVHLLLIYRAKAAAIVFSQPTVPYTQAVHMHWHTNLALLGTCFLEKKKKKKSTIRKNKANGRQDIIVTVTESIRLCISPLVTDKLLELNIYIDLPITSNCDSNQAYNPIACSWGYMIWLGK